MSRTNKENLTAYTKYLKAYISDKIAPITEEADGNVTIATFNIENDNTTVIINNISNKVEIDWGDGAVTIGTGEHTYLTSGQYVCRFYNLTLIPLNAFINAKCKNYITSIKIGNNVSQIRNSAFQECSNLTSVEMGNNVTEICESAFEKCSKLTEIVLPEGLTIIGNRAIRETAITKIVLPSTVTSVGAYAFYGCKQLKSFTMIDGLDVTFGRQTFGGDSSLVEVKLSNSLTKLSNQMFQNCTSLKSVIIPNSVVAIENGYTFLNCTDLIVYCERKSPASDWHSTWDMLTTNGPKCSVVWGYKHKDYPTIVTELGSLSTSNLDQDFFNSLYN